MVKKSVKSASSADKSVSPGHVAMRRVRVGLLKEAAYNPRKKLRPGDEEWDGLVRSVRAFGYVDPLVWNERSGNLVGGHQRLAVMKHLHGAALKTVDVSVVDLDHAREQALNLALNKVKGEWDDTGLRALLATLPADLPTGFSEAERKAIAEGERLVEMLVPPPPREDGEDEETGSGGEEEEEGVKAGKSRGGVAEVWQVVVECSGEREQKKLFEKLGKEGFTCKLQTM